METIRRIRQVIGPESETLIWVAVGIAAVFALAHFWPTTGWPALIPAILMDAAMLGGLLWTIKNAAWRRWRQDPIRGVALLAATVMTVAANINAWADFREVPPSHWAMDVQSGGSIFFFVVVLSQLWVRRQRTT